MTQVHTSWHAGRNPVVLLWLAFWAVAAMTAIVDRCGRMLDAWQAILNLLGLLQMILAASLVRTKGWGASVLAHVVLGLLLGQWWFVESTFMQVVWRLSGFGP